MKQRLLPLLLLAALAASSGLAQNPTNAPADDWKPASSNQPGKEYPKVNSEGRVKFRIMATNAQNVGVTFRDSSPFSKGINSHFYVSPDTAHEWQTWRRSLREFAPLLFQN